MEPLRDPWRVRRMARVICSDIALYAGDELRMGLEKDDLFDRLAPQIEAARCFFRHHVDPALPDTERIFDHALVDMIVYANRRVATHIW